MRAYEPVRTPRHEHRTVRGLKHRLTWWGESCADPLVLLHGFMDCAATFQFLVDRLPGSPSCVALDWRGFGGSDWACDGYWFADYLADLDALLDEITPGPVRIVGHSMGANIAGLYAGVRPERVRAFVNLEGIGLAPTRAADAPGRYRQWLEELRSAPANTVYGSVEDLAAVLRRRNPRLPAAHAAFVAGAWSRPVEAAGGAVRLAFDPLHRRVNPVLYRREEAEACWMRMRAPMLLLTGSQSEHARGRLALLPDTRLRELFHDVRCVELRGLGHMMHHEDPQAVARPIAEFLASVA